MTERAEIERLLQKTGRTLEGLPDTYPLDVRVHGILDIAKYEGLSPGAYKLIDRILHQSDVIELLISALQDSEPVVRCGHCKWYDHDLYVCSKLNIATNPDDFCSMYGDKKKTGD